MRTAAGGLVCLTTKEEGGWKSLSAVKQEVDHEP